MVTVPKSTLERFRAFSLYNSPYRAHEDGRAIDLYPEHRDPAATTVVPSPVAGDEVRVLIE